MSDYYSNHVSGFFSYREQAEAVIAKLIASGFSRSNLHFLDKYAVLPTHVMKGSNASTLNDIVLLDVHVHDAILSGQIVVIAETKRVDEVNIAEKIIQSVSGNSYDVM